MTEDMEKRYRNIKCENMEQEGNELVIGMLLVSRSGLGGEDAVEVFHYYDFPLSSSFM